MAENRAGKRVPLLLTLLILTVVAFFVFLYYNRRSIVGNGNQSLNLPFASSHDTLPEVPKIYSKQSIFERIQALNFISYVNLPVQVGSMGKANPFEPFEGFMQGSQLGRESTSTPSAPASSSNASNSSNPAPETISQGSK